MWILRRYVLVLGIIFTTSLVYLLLLRAVDNIGRDETLISISMHSKRSGAVPESWKRTIADHLGIERPSRKPISFANLNNDQDLSQSNWNQIEYHSNLKKLLISQGDVSQFDFRSCRMSNCFDFSRCRFDGPIKVNIIANPGIKSDGLNITGESNIIHNRILKIIKESKYYEPDPAKACLFILEDDTIDRDPLSQSFNSFAANLFQPKHNYGLNYLVFNLYSGSWPDYKEDDFAGFSIGAAILAKASNSIVHHRPDFDISLPLFSYLHGSQENADYNIDSESEQIRKYFLTFKGKRYVVGTGSEARNSLYHLDNQKDVIMLTTCRHGKNWRDSKDSRCADDENKYNNYDFNELMKESTFCLTPRGRRLGSFRFLEALGFGCIPVIISDGWVWPFDELIDWSEAALQFNEKLLLLVPDMLRDIRPDKINEMRANCLTLYTNYFSSIERIVITTLDILERRIKNQVRIS